MKKRWRFWIGFAIPALFLAALGVAYRPVVVTGTSMMPTLYPRQVALMDRHRPTELHRGDIVVLDIGGEQLIKRVYAIEGDSLELVQLPNGSRFLIATSGYPAPLIRRQARERPKDMRIVHAKVPPGHLYVLGDNVRASADSREFGPVPESRVLGRLVKPGDALRHLPANLRAALPRAHAREKGDPVR